MLKTKYESFGNKWKEKTTLERFPLKMLIIVVKIISLDEEKQKVLLVMRF